MSSQVVDEEEQKQEEDFAGENVDEEDEQQQQRSRQAGRRKKRAARELFNESGQTDSERRVLRKNQRSLYDRLANDQRDATAAAAAEPGDNDDNNDESLQFLGSLRDENNRLWKNVRYTREAVLDADNVDLITNKYVQHVDRLVQVSESKQGCVFWCTCTDAYETAVTVKVVTILLGCFYGNRILSLIFLLVSCVLRGLGS